MQQDTYILSKDEYAEYLVYKKDKILKQAQSEAQRIDEELAKVLSNHIKEIAAPKNLNGSANVKESFTDKSKKGAVGWRQILEETLKDGELSYSDIVDSILKRPALGVAHDVARKSISSNLGTYSREGANQRYKWEERDGKRYYSLI